MIPEYGLAVYWMHVWVVLLCLSFMVSGSSIYLNFLKAVFDTKMAIAGFPAQGCQSAVNITNHIRNRVGSDIVATDVRANDSSRQCQKIGMRVSHRDGPRKDDGTLTFFSRCISISVQVNVS